MSDRRPIRQRLMAFYSEVELDLWIYSPHPQLNGDSPRHRVDQGRAEDVHLVIDRMEEGAYL